ncbi:TPA: DUF551 domain-containing protein [Enterobacter hormaechei subsp. xiangfangensis]|uniref:DUF551 domain-containing protein n=1 Tax=Enterobacter hormaechei TaxID=158836 RepID=UPI002863AD79|nr:DUF551 domain-containing protein [Enterobacter hormaechei]ELD3313752.1 DUF551 domain-containing protein [Enterobacter hormaechei]ELD3472794.1 DUF551 domain-containing protein [Enterobacter hormaechei]ELD3486794.1 DUF551 domain-containing protein [Enterobacter hormaechei]MDR9958888.1 DUF551 domain-containing protein [Enterobacter hormaechei subsp. xiangfangensis]MDS0074649.1 DUF551 domain-containing protein [Enterobacter hormaechei subsp. xiangfangensis]
MSTLTKEWLQQTIAELEEERDAVPGIVNEDAAMALAAMKRALASLEAEPVCVIDQSNLDYLKSGSDADVWPASRAEMGDVLLYRSATPAPVSVPDAIHSQGEKSASDDYYALGWNACRAAMLKHSEPFIVTSDHRMMEMPQVEAINAVTAMLQGADDNSPVVPDGWVACSERMPEDEEDVLCFGKYGDNDIDEERYQFMVWLSSKGIKKVWRVSDGDSQNRRARVTHWMPLPAAPQQEADNG